MGTPGIISGWVTSVVIAFSCSQEESLTKRSEGNGEYTRNLDMHFSFLLLLTLAVSDLGVGFLVQPFSIAWMINPP